MRVDLTIDVYLITKLCLLTWGHSHISLSVDRSYITFCNHYFCNHIIFNKIFIVSDKA